MKSMLGTTRNSEYFLSPPNFLIFFKKRYHLICKILIHLGGFFFPELSVASESFKTSDFFFLLSVGGDTQWAAFPLLWGKNGNLARSQGYSIRIDILASAFEVKMVTRDKNIFASNPKKRTFLFVFGTLVFRMSISLRIILSTINTPHRKVKSHFQVLLLLAS